MEDSELNPIRDVFTEAFLGAENWLLNPEGLEKKGSEPGRSPCCELRGQELHYGKQGISSSTSVLCKLVIYTEIPGDSRSAGLPDAHPTSLLLLSNLPSAQQLK